MSKTSLYESLIARLRGLLADEWDRVANAANTAALVHGRLPEVNWVGFYFRHGEELVVGPFQGRPACTRIILGRGVCGAAALRRATLVVPDVHAFEGHIACDPASRSEIVVPVVVGSDLVGVFDVDSPRTGRFDEEDREGLEAVVNVYVERTDFAR